MFTLEFCIYFIAACYHIHFIRASTFIALFTIFADFGDKKCKYASLISLYIYEELLLQTSLDYLLNWFKNNRISTINIKIFVHNNFVFETHFLFVALEIVIIVGVSLKLMNSSTPAKTLHRNWRGTESQNTHEVLWFQATRTFYHRGRKPITFVAL